MKTLIITLTTILILAGCGSGNSIPLDQNISNEPNTTSYQTPIQYPSQDNLGDTNQTVLIPTSSTELNDTTPLTATNVGDAIKKAGYSFDGLNLDTLFRGTVDYEKYIYLTSKNSTVAILGNYVYAIEDTLGRKILFTVDGPSNFDAIECSHQLVLRANFNPTLSTQRYILPFAPTGYFNLNTTQTNPNATVATLIEEIVYAFNQLTLTNPSFTQCILGYHLDPQTPQSSIVCNATTIPLVATSSSVDIAQFLDPTAYDRIDCHTDQRVLIGSIIRTTQPTETNETTLISGDLYRFVTLSTPQTAGQLYSDPSHYTFVSHTLSGQYGKFEIFESGKWIYQLDFASIELNGMDLTKSIKESFEVATINGATAVVIVEFGDETFDIGEIFEGMAYIHGYIFDKTFNQTIEAKSYRGHYGDLQVQIDGSWKYHLDNSLPEIKALNDGDTLTDLFAITSQINVEITIKGHNTLIEGNLYGSTIEEVQTMTEGKLDIKYSNDAMFEPYSVDGTYGTFKIDSDGLWHYKLKKLTEIILKLTSKDEFRETFDVKTTDGMKVQVGIKIIGVDSIILGDLSGVVSLAKSSTQGKIYIERGVNLFKVIDNKMGLYGVLNLHSNGEWSYTLSTQNSVVSDLDANGVLHDLFEVVAMDNTTQTIKIEIVGSNTPLYVDKQPFDLFPTLIDSPNQHDILHPIPLLNATGDRPKISYRLNGESIEGGTSGLFKGGIENILEVNVEEMRGDFETQSFSKIVKLKDITPPKAPLLEHETATDKESLPVLIEAFEDNVSVFVNGVHTQDIPNSAQKQTIILDTSGNAGLKIFNITLKDALGNESNRTKVEIQKTIANNTTNFSEVRVQNINYDYNLIGGVLAGTIVDTDGIAQIVVSYTDGTSNAVFNPTANTTFTFPHYDYLQAHDFGTHFTITLTDLKGVVSSHNGIIEEQDEPTHFVESSIYPSGGFYSVTLHVEDFNGIETVKINNDGNLTQRDLNGSTTDYITESVEENKTLTIEVIDAFNNSKTYTKTFIQYPADFSQVAIQDNNNSTAALMGNVIDANGISHVSVNYYDSNGTWYDDDFLSGDGNTSVALWSLPPHSDGNKYIIGVSDNLGDYRYIEGIFPNLP